MQYMMLYRPGHDDGAPPSQQEMTEMGKLIEEMTRDGVLIATGGLLPSSTGARVAVDGGKFTVTDGPFAEVKELIGGYAIVEAAGKPEAIERARRFLQVVGRGTCEVRPMFSPPDVGAASGAHSCTPAGARL